MGSASRVFKNTMFLIASNLTTKVLGALFIILLARHLEDYGFGQYSFAFSFVAVFIIFADFGLDAITVKNVARDREMAGDYLELVGLLRLGLSLLMVSAAVIGGYILGLEEHLLIIILVAGLVYLFDKLSGLFYALFRAYERMELEAVVQVTWKVIQVVVGVSAMYLGYGLLDIVLFLLVVSVIRCILGFTIILKIGIKPSRKSLGVKTLVKKSTPFAAYEIGNALYFNLIIIMLFIIQSPEETGWFNAAFRILMFLILIPAAFETALYPLFSRLYDESKDDLSFAYGKSMKFSLIAALPVAMLLMVLSELFAGLFGTEFDNTAQCLKFIAIALPFFTLNMLMKTALWSADAQNRMAKNIWGSAVILAIVSFFLVSEESYIGAALALAIGEACLFALNAQAIRKKGFPMKQYIWKPAVSGFVMFVFAFGAVEFLGDYLNQYWIATFSFLIFTALLFALGTFTKTDKDLLMSALRRGPHR